MHTYFSLITKLRLNNVNSQVLLCYQAALKACLHLTSFSPFNAAPFNGPFLFSIVFMKNGPFFTEWV